MNGIENTPAPTPMDAESDAELQPSRFAPVAAGSSIANYKAASTATQTKSFVSRRNQDFVSDTSNLGSKTFCSELVAFRIERQAKCNLNHNEQTKESGRSIFDSSKGRRPSIIQTAPVDSVAPKNEEFDTVIIRPAKSCNIQKFLLGCKKPSPDVLNLCYYESRGISPRILKTPSPATSSFISPPGIDSQTSSFDSSDLVILGPHSPPYQVSDSFINNPEILAGDGVSNRVIPGHPRLALHPSRLRNPSNFRQYMEERLARWRPSFSDQGVDESINGRHPYQLNGFKNFSTGANNEYQILVKIREWWTGLVNSNIAEESNNRTNDDHASAYITTMQNEGRVFNFTNLLDILNPHSSESFVLPIHQRHYQNSSYAPSINQRENHIELEPGPSEPMGIMPKAIPFNNFNLNFDKVSTTNPSSVIGTSPARHAQVGVEGELDEEITRLISGQDNFIVSCFESIWSCIGSLNS